jgi:hypothetical protein
MNCSLGVKENTNIISTRIRYIHKTALNNTKCNTVTCIRQTEQCSQVELKTMTSYNPQEAIKKTDLKLYKSLYFPMLYTMLIYIKGSSS